MPAALPNFIAIIAFSCAGGAYAAASFTTLYTFAGGYDGAIPSSGLTPDGQGGYFGTTLRGGNEECNQAGCGTVYHLTPPAADQTVWTETVIYSFLGGTQGWQPSGNLLLGAHGELYGTTRRGDINFCPNAYCGTVFSLTPPSGGSGQWTLAILYEFLSPTGSEPVSGVIAGPSGTLYGTALGDSAYQQGIVFQLTPPRRGQLNWTETDLYRFNDEADGGAPFGGLVLGAKGALFGPVASYVGNCIEYSGGCGGIYRLSRPAHGDTNWTETPLYAFKGGADGAVPQYTLLPDGSGGFYGATAYDGQTSGHTCQGVYGCGMVFHLAPHGGTAKPWRETVVYRFGSAPDGYMPAGPVIMVNGALFGTAGLGGSGNCGSVYELQRPARKADLWTPSEVYGFQCGADGGGPQQSLAADPGGALLGVTGYSAQTPNGTVFSVLP
jgi:hypothetical protein